MPKLSFQIFIAGKSNRNDQLVRSFQEACQAHLSSKAYEVAVIDLARNAQLAEQHKILATPTILRNRPAPEKRVIGNLTADGALQALQFLIEDLNQATNEKG